MQLSPKEFSDRAFRLVDEYRRNVKSGKTITGEDMKLLMDYADNLEPDYEIRKDIIDNVFRFISLINVEQNEEYKQIMLEPFQCYFIYYVFGTYLKGSGQRRYSTSFLFMGRKNAKTTLSVVLTSYVLLSGEWANPQSIILSSVEARKQVLEDFHKVVLNSPALEPYLRFSNYWVYINNDRDTADGGERKLKKLKDVGFCKIVPNVAKKLDSFKLVSAIIDEIHLFEDWSTYLTAKKGTGARQNSLMMLISTAGFIPDGFCADFVTYCKEILRGQYKDDTVFPMMYMLDKGDEQNMGDENIWYKTNPGLGPILKLHKVREWYNEAKYNPKARADFLTKTLNIFLDSDEASLLPAEYIEKSAREVNESGLKGKKCYIGVDLSKTNDLSCVLALFINEEEKDGKIEEYWEAIPYFFMVNDPDKFIRARGLDMRKWIDYENNKGPLILCPGKSMDYDMIANKLRELVETYDVQGIGYDPMGWNFVSDKLDINNLGIAEGSIIPIIQGPKTMGGALVYLMKLFYDEKISIGTNPVMKWTLRNAKIKVADGNNNPKIFKNKRKDSDEGAVALNNAATLYYKLELDPDRQAF